ncbi:hypothetical protein EJB05_54909, partial [Eragrostis curvula]
NMMAIRVRIPLLVCLIFAIFTTNHIWGEKDCYKEKELVRKHCLATITVHGDYVPPNNPCRHVVESSDMVCICRTLTSQEEVTISATKLVRLAHDCHKPVPIGSKCGSKLDSSAACTILWKRQIPMRNPESKARTKRALEFSCSRACQHALPGSGSPSMPHHLRTVAEACCLPRMRSAVVAAMASCELALPEPAACPSE